MKKHFLSIALVTFSSAIFSQNILITDADLGTANPMACAGVAPPNFFDSGNNTGDYGANENEIIVICPDYAAGTSKLSLTFGINAGLSFNVDVSDTVFVYDGLNTSAPLLGTHNSVTDPNGFNHIASFGSNPSGCLTVQFVSDAATEGTGWEASVSCIQSAQPFESHMAGYLNGTDIITPSDTGYSDVCFGDSILFVAAPNFLYSSDVTGIGYAQNTNNVTYEWAFSNGQTSTNDSVWFKPPARNGYVVSLKIIDQFPFSQTITSKIRVSTIPSFSGVEITRDNICAGDTTVIVGAVTNTDTSGVDPTTSSFQLGGSVAGQVYLPDGSGVSYSDTIHIAGFIPGDMVANITDLQQLCLNMEHSYLGDLEMQLTCPNGTTIDIFNSYTGNGLAAGGFGGSNTYLGHPVDNNLGTPGAGEEYCWSSTQNTYGDFPTEYAANNFVALTTASSPSAGNSMNWNGIYAPEQSFINLLGCPLNGDWSITVRDNMGIDDGYIFEWSILFDPILNPNNETYVPTIVSAQWLSGATVLPGLPTDTFIVVSSDLPGIQNYTFEVTDDFGCTYDTTVNITFIARPTVSISGSGTECGGLYQASGTTSHTGGVWSFSGPGTASFSPNLNSENPLISIDINGTYNFTFTDNQCNIDSTISIYFADSITPFSLIDKEFCLGDDAILEANSQVSEAAYLWNTGEISSSIIVTDSGYYSLTITGLCNSKSDTALVVANICSLTAANVVTPNADGKNDFLVIKGVEYYPESTLKVFNRWGNVIYESSNYKNDWSPIDIDAGTYFYVFTPGGVLDAEIVPTSFTIFK